MTNSADFTHQPTYRRLRDIYAERTNKLVFFCGAGLSASGGLPTWLELRAKLEAELDAKSHQLSPQDEAERLRKLAAIKAERNPWVAFQRLRKALGKASYTASIREALAPALKIAPPSVYSNLWSLRPKGILNLNLDRLATRAHAQLESIPEVPNVISEFSGIVAGGHSHLLGSSSQFVANLHGVADDEASWILTHEEIVSLLANTGYWHFIHAVFASCTVVFLGVRADDIAAGGLLGSLREEGSDPGQHFWITERSDAKGDRWAEQNGIQVVRYDASAGHAEALRLLTNDLRQFRPVDEPPAPVVPAPLSVSEVPNLAPHEVARLAPEEIRRFLSARATRILQGSGSETSYEEFCRKYAQAIHNAWYIDLEPPNNVLFGALINDKIGQGAFGTVYAATRRDGTEVAVKLLRQEIRENQPMLGSFRRGVRSMKILRERGVKGMVPYLEAYELPPCVVMERVPGPDLEQVVTARTLDPWPDGLRVLVDTARIVHEAHCTPERVFHRDLRPANIMLRDFYSAPDSWSVVVLDFDLSWHLGATEKSIVDFSAGAALGYLAPEQLTPRPGVSTRNGAVDAYGLAMTAYFVFSGQHPRPGEAISPDWSQRVLSATGRRKCMTWSSASRRLARIILGGTQQDQYYRLDMAQLRGELERVLQAVRSPEMVESSELWAEELLCSAFPEEAYTWDYNKLSGRLDSPTGWSIEVTGNESSHTVEASITWTHTGSRDRKTLDKHVRELTQKSETILRRAGWSVSSAGPGNEVVMLRATVNIADIKRHAIRLAEALRAQKGAAK